MDKYGSSSKYGAPSGPSSADVNAELGQLQQRIDAEQLQMMVQLQQQQCFKRCIPKPGDRISSYEKECISNCVDRFNESYELVTKSYVEAQRKGRY
eukprot:m.334730 g.334730  ORF g.334730 m.334730 type:complete len:96 (+) comp17421_c0_seq1:776-1063(+)